MKVHRCSDCVVSMSPWEAKRCLTCKLRTPWALSIADAAVFVLEKEQRPVTTYDVARGIQRELGREVSMSSLAATLAGDRRCCWAGRSMYGLYRHGIFPGPRNLSGVATLFLYSHRHPVRMELLAFAMQYAGYRFQHASLKAALRQDPNIGCDGWLARITKPRKEVRGRLRWLGVSPTFRGVDSMAEKCGLLVDEAFSEYERRLAGY